MKKEDVLNLMTGLPPDLIEEADFDAPAKRRLPQIARTGLVAACLCLALIGTAFAAVTVYRLTVQPHSYSDEYGDWFGYRVSGDIIRRPMDAFSPELRAAYESRGDSAWAGADFDTRAELQAFLGEAVPLVWPDPGIVPETTLHAILWALTGPEDDVAGPLKVIHLGPVSGTELEENLSVYTSVYVYTENHPADREQIYGSYGSQPVGAEPLGTYAMANGDTAELIAADDPPESGFGWGEFICNGHFVHDGALYIVTLSAHYNIEYEPGLQGGGCPGDIRAHTLSQLYRVLDSYPAG